MGYPSVEQAEADGIIDNPHVLSDDELDSLIFVYEPRGDARRGTFRERLNEMIAEGVEMPCFFASTEY